MEINCTSIYENEQPENKYKTIPFTIVLKRHIKINLEKEVQDLYNKVLKTFLREIKYDLNKWRDTTFTDWKTQYC